MHAEVKIQLFILTHELKRFLRIENILLTVN